MRRSHWQVTGAGAKLPPKQKKLGWGTRRRRRYKGKLATFGLSAELAHRWLRSCRALPTASRFWKLPRSSNSLCNSSSPSCSSRPRARRLPLPVARQNSSTHRSAHESGSGAVRTPLPIVGSVCIRARLLVVPNRGSQAQGFSPCEIRTQGLKPGSLGAEVRHG